MNIIIYHIIIYSLILFFCITYKNLFVLLLIMSDIDFLNDIIKIEPNIFKEHYNKVDNQNVNTFLNRKKTDIYTSTCFHTTFESYHNINSQNGNHSLYQNKKYNSNNTKNYGNHYGNHNKNHGNHHQGYHINHVNNTHENQGGDMHNTHHTNHRLYIISSDFSDDQKIKKSFTSHLNKLTNQNVDIIYTKIRNEIKDNIEYHDMLYKIVWDFIKNSSDELYINILQFFDQKLTNDYYDTYVNNKLWLPNEKILNNNILNNDESLYDIYCDYVKWKKEIINIHKAWCIIKSNYHHDKILNELYDYFIKYNNSKVHKHIVDFSLEQLFIFFKRGIKKHDIVDKLRLLDLNNFDSSTKFLIMNIIDLKI